MEISKATDFRTHLNQYDVIHIDIQWFLSNCREASGVVPFIEKSVLNELREIYPDAVSPEVVSLSDGLSLVKEETGQKFVIIID